MVAPRSESIDDTRSFSRIDRMNGHCQGKQEEVDGREVKMHVMMNDNMSASTLMTFGLVEA